MSWFLEWSNISSESIFSMLKLFSQMFMLLREDWQMSWMKERQVVFHSYFTIWMRIVLHFDRIVCSGRARLSTAEYCRIRSTM